MIGGLWHASFHVADLDRSIAFYVDLLGLRLVHRQDQDNDYTRSLVGYPDAVLKVAQLAVPGRPEGVSTHDIELVEYVVPRGSRQDPARHHPGAAHIAFPVTDIAAEYQRLEAAGVVFVSPPNEITQGVNAGGSACYFTDPDDCTLELVQPPPHRMHLLYPATARPVALHSVLAEGQEGAYEQAHAQIPEDLLAALQNAGVRDWTIWRSGRDLFHVVDAEDLVHAAEVIATDPADLRWQQTMAPLVEGFRTDGAGPWSTGLRVVWSLRGQVATGAGAAS